MLYLFYGTDVQKVRTKAFEWVEKARAKEPNLTYVRLAREEIHAGSLEEAALSGGLFVGRLLVLLDDPFPAARALSDDDEEPHSAEASQGKEGGDGNVVEEYIDALASSDNAIVILAPKLAAAKAKKLVAKAKVEYKYDKPAAREAVRGFNSNLVNALTARSREKLWLEINRALSAGDAPEMLHALLHWKARDLMEKGGAKWTSQESRKLSLELIELLQTSRRGGLDLSLSLEHFALTI
jgi:DNA polymerase III delta subunit